MTTLPLMESALLSTVAKSLVQIEIEPRPLIPARPLEAGEQYRFHFDMTKCIGCKCCVVACNEQNGNPAAHQLAARRRSRGRLLSVHAALSPLDGLQSLPGAVLPDRLPGGGVHKGPGDRRGAAQRRHLHRLPVLHLELLLRRAAVQPRARRRRQVRHVPQPAGRRHGAGLRGGVSRRRDRDRNRQRRRVAHAIIWRRTRPGCRRPTTASPPRASRCRRIWRRIRDAWITQRVEPEHPHWPLVFMLVLTQLSVGAFAVLWLLDMLGRGDADWRSRRWRRWGSRASAWARPRCISGGRSTPGARCKGLRRSWLSREVLTLSLFAGVASAFAGMLLLDLPGRGVGGLADRSLLGSRASPARRGSTWCRRGRRGTAATPSPSSSRPALLLGPLFVRSLAVDGRSGVGSRAPRLRAHPRS